MTCAGSLVRLSLRITRSSFTLTATLPSTGMETFMETFTEEYSFHDPAIPD